MKRLKLFFACLLMAVLSIGQVWADDPAAVGTTLFSEDFSSYSADDVPSGSVSAATGRVIYGGGSVTYTSTNGTGTKPGTTKIWNENTGGGTAPEILVGKQGTSGTPGSFKIAGIPSGGAQVITVSWTQNKQLLTGILEGTGYSTTYTFPKPTTTTATISFDITVADGADETFDLTLRASSSNVRVDDILITVKTAGEGGSSTPTCATPTFTPTSGDFTGSINVTLACTTEGAAIHYTTDGTEPTASSATYTAAIPVSETTTIKAIAVADGYENSSIASKTYTKHDAYTTIQALFDDKTNTSTPVYVTFDGWKISGVKGGQAFLTDGTKGLIIYQNSHGFSVGDALSGTAACNLIAYKGAAEITGLTSTSTGLIVTAGSMGDAVAKTIDELGAVNTSALVTISNVTYDGTNLSDGTNSIKPYNGLFSSMSFENGKKYNVTGVLNYYDALQIMPRSAADIVEVVEEGAPANPTFSPAAGTYTSVQSVEISCETEGATIYYTTDGSTPTNESTVYASAIEVGADMTIKAIAIKNAKESTVATAVYTINLPEDETVQKTWDLSIDETATASEEALTWTATYVDMSFAKGTSTTNANNYYPGTSGQSYTSTRTYKNSVITITPASSKQITTVVFTATTEGYATTLKNAAWTNATATATGSTVTVTAAGSGAISAKLGGTAGFSAVTVHYEPYVAPATYAVAFATPDHGTLTISNGETPIASGDEFEEGTELTVSTEPASGYILDAIKVIETGSDPENDVTSTVLSGSTLTVPAFAITVSATFVENVAPVATLTLSENGVSASFPGEHHQGDVVNLPLTSSAECVKDFVGWSANASCAVAPEYAPGAEYTLASTSQTLYAVYATASGSSYVKTALASIASGSEVVITELYDETIYAAANDGGTSAGPSEIVLTESATDVLNIGDNTNIFWIISKDGDNFSFTVKGGTDKLYCTNTNNGVRVGTNENNVFSINSNYLYNNATSRYVGYNHESGGLFRCYTTINSNINNETLAFYKKTASYSDFATTCVAALADPEFTPAAGVYTEAKNIVITAEEGTIYYTLDGTDPTSSSDKYTAPIVLDANGTTTIKAIAISATSQSAIVTATYTINLPLSTIQAVYDKAVEVGGTATAVNIKFTNWVVSGISTDNKNVYVTDGEKGFVIYDSEADHGFAVNDKLNGTVATSLKLYNKYADVIGLKANAEGLTVTHDGIITPVAATIADLGAVNTGAPIILNGVLFDGSVLSDGVNSITPYTTFYADAVTSLESDKYYNITGIYVHFNNTKEIAPRSAADIVESVLVDPEISYDPASDEITKGEEGSWSAPSLGYVEGFDGLALITYESSNEAVATVTDAGVIALAGGTGTATITATFGGNATYGAGNATYTITVNAPAPTPTGTTYTKVTSTDGITDGEYLIVYEGDATHAAMAFNGSLENVDQAKVGVAVTINEGVIEGTEAIDAATFTIDVTAGTLQSASGYYIGRETYDNGMDKSTETAYTNTFAISEGNAVITGAGNCTLRYNYASDQLRFRYYKSGQQAIQLYKKDTPTPATPDYTRDVTGVNYGTICLPKAGTIEGATLYEIGSFENSLIYIDEVGSALAAGVPYIFQASASELKVYYTDKTADDVPAGNANGLIGFYNLSDPTATFNIPEDAENYILYNDQYWLVSGRAAYIANYRAYIKLGSITPKAAAPGRRRVAMTVNGKDAAQGFENIESGDAPMKVMIEGTMYILRGEKVYDATGRLVK